MRKFLLFVFCLALATGCLLIASPQSGQAAPAEDIYLHIGSPLALADGKLLPIDHADPDISPRLNNSYTLVPLRFVSEYFGANVSYDADAKTAVIAINGQTARFPLGSASYTLNGAARTLGTATMLVDGKAMVPLRAICEEVLGLPIEYREGVIRIGTAGALTEKQVREVKAKIGQYLQVESLDELKKHMTEINNDIAFAMAINRTAPSLNESSLPAPVAAPEPAAETDAALAADYSQTNAQTAGVDESDILKTDGKYIYSCAGNMVKLVAAEGGSLKLAGQIELPANYSITDMYVDGPYVIAVGSYYYSSENDSAPEALRLRTAFTFARVYDVSAPNAPRLHREYGIQGEALTTRKQGDYLYLLTFGQVTNYDLDPRPYMLDKGALAPMPLDRVLITPRMLAIDLLTLSAVNIRDTAEPAGSKTIPGSAGETYMSNNAFYVASHNYFAGSDSLTITRFALDGAKIGYAGSGLVKGSVSDQFSMDEYDGYLRLATSESWSGNANHLFILDENMDICGQVNDYAPGERIYSARFMGQRGYVVTFRQIDPLFVFDLSNPRDPKITGELKVPGFSNYLHPVAENVLLGVGQDTGDLIFRDSRGQETVVGQRAGGLKISLFDVSDMGKPKELDTLVLGSQCYSELFNNHKAAMFKAEESLLAFPVQLQAEDDNRDDYFNGALLISYKGNKLGERGRISDENVYENGFADAGSSFYYSSYRRTAYIGNTLYYLQNGLLRAFDLGTLKESGRLLL